jgi:hypothetical protein
LSLRFIDVASLALRSGLRQEGSVLSYSLPSPNPSARWARLGNGLGYIMSRLRRSEHR